jgi:hypothetical protein
MTLDDCTIESINRRRSGVGFTSQHNHGGIMKGRKPSAVRPAKSIYAGIDAQIAAHTARHERLFAALERVVPAAARPGFAAALCAGAGSGLLTAAAVFAALAGREAE